MCETKVLVTYTISYTISAVGQLFHEIYLNLYAAEKRVHMLQQSDGHEDIELKSVENDYPFIHVHKSLFVKFNTQGAIKLGVLNDSLYGIGDPCYTTPELFYLAELKYKELLLKETIRNDLHYSKPWV